MSGSTLRAVVAGGSMGGLAAAISLARGGADVRTYERSRRPLEGRGAGIVLHPVTTSLIKADVASFSAHTSRLQYFDVGGRVSAELPCNYRFTSYSALHAALLGEFDSDRYRLASEVTGFEQDADAVAVRLSSGERVECDLLVAADGISSRARATLAPQTASRYAGYVGWRGTVLERDLDKATAALLDDAITYCVIPDSHILIYPIPGEDGSSEPGARQVNWVWYRNVAEGPGLDRVLTDRNGVRQPVSVGSGAAADEVVADLCRDAEDLLPGPVHEVVARSPEPFVQVVFDIEVPQMAFGRVALIGDAAFAIRPHIAVGTAKAAENGISIAAQVSDPASVAADLVRWQPRQIELGRTAMARSAKAGQRSQFTNSWSIGDPLPFGLFADGDSQLT